MMEPYVLCLGVALNVLAFADSGRIKRQNFQDFQTFDASQDFGLAFFTVDGTTEPQHQQQHQPLPSPTPPPSRQQHTNQQATHVANHRVEEAHPFRKSRKQELPGKIPGIAGVDYPTFHKVPPTNFRCSDTPAVPGMYANVETGCQAYHICHDGRDGPQGASFLCTNGTLFNQKEFTCDWWYNVDCGLSLLYYSLNLDPLRNPYTKQEKEQELRKFQEFHRFQQQPQHHEGPTPANQHHRQAHLQFS